MQIIPLKIMGYYYIIKVVMNMKEKTVNFGSNIKMLRKKHNYTRTQLAEKLGYSAKTIEKWEFGNSIPSVETICTLSDFFGVTIDSLIFSSKPDIKYLLAIDGGGSKTEFLLTDTEKREISRVILGPSNPVDIGMENLKILLEQGIHKVCAGIRLREVSVFAGLAGGMTGDNKQLINEFLASFNFGAYSNGSDTENVLEMALDGGDGVAVIMGTGIIAFAQSGGKRYRIGGWGYHIDKMGSGYNIASEAIYSAVKYIDGRDGSVILKDLLEKKLGKSLPDSIAELHQKGRGFIASFAPLVFEAYDKGDKYAANIIDNNIKEVAEMIAVGKKHLSKGKCKVVICGGLCKRTDIMEPVFKKYLSSDFEIRFSDEPVVNGALMLADKNKGNTKV